MGIEASAFTVFFTALSSLLNSNATRNSHSVQLVRKLLTITGSLRICALSKAFTYFSVGE